MYRQFLQTSAECPVCKRACQLSELRKFNISSKQTQKTRRGRGARAHQYNTRSFSRSLFPENQTPNLNIASNIQNDQVCTPDRNNLQSLPNAYALSPNDREVNIRSNDIGIDYNRINEMIENNLTRILQNMNIFPNTLANGNATNRPTEHVSNQVQSRNTSRISPNNVSNISNSSYQPDKISSIIRNWNLEFNGSESGLNVEEFLYRVRILTRDTFNSDFGLICKNLHILLTGKARDWFWRYHKNGQNIEWEDFCDAIRWQYRDFKSSFDIREEIRNRKQKPGESFDFYFDAVSTIMDRLSSPMSETELIEVLTRNLRPEIRQDLLYVPIHTIPQLRKLVKKRENFLNDEHVRKNLASRNNTSFAPRKYVSELDGSDCQISSDSVMEPDISVNAIQTSVSTKCWNCDESGHHWMDCLHDRKIFCYGCGAEGIYKPNCEKCAAKRQMFSKNFKSPPPTVN